MVVCPMNEEQAKRNRRSTRLSISIPVIITGVDAEGNKFSEGVRTLIVNKHGGKVATTQHLAMGTEILIENLALGAVGKANVVWRGEKEYPGGIHHIGLQMIEAQNVWGIEFPPDDWASDLQEEPSIAPDAQPAAQSAGAESGEAQAPSMAGDETTLKLLQELRESADAHAHEFQDRLKELIHRLGLEMEFDLRERAAYAKVYEMGVLQQEIKALRDIVLAAREEIGRLDAKVEELQCGFEAASSSAPPPPLQEAQRQFTALLNSVVESMNRSAEAGLTEYRNLLKKENQEAAGPLRLAAEAGAGPPRDPARKS